MMTERIAKNPRTLSALPAGTERMVRVHPLTIGAVFEDPAGVGHGYVLNMSLGGVFLTTESELQLGQRLRLRFFLPFQSGPVEADVRVRWRSRDVAPPSRPPAEGFGLEFVDIETKDLASVNRFIDRFVGLASDLD